MTDLDRFCGQFAIDPASARRALELERAEETSALAAPWLMRLVVGVGAWITGLAAIGLGFAILMQLMDVERELTVAFLGAIYLGLGLWLLRIHGRGAFAVQLGVAVAAAGVAMVAAGIAMEMSGLLASALSSVAATVLIVMMTPNRTLQFLSATLAAWLLVMTLQREAIAYYLDIAALAGPVGVYLSLRPPRRDLQPTALVLLLLFPVFAMSAEPAMYIGAIAGDAPKPGGWFAKGVHIMLFLWLVAVHGRHAESAGVWPRLGVFAAAAVVVCLLLPPGGSAALVIMMVAFVLGSRPLALLGTLLQIFFISRFYYDLDVTLLVKSGLLTAVGIVLLTAGWLLARHTPPEAAR